MELDPECRKLELDTFLSQPWQRMMHYPLLFQNILKKTLEDHPDQANLSEVIKRLNDIISRVNGYTESEQSSRVFDELNVCVSNVSKQKAQVGSRPSSMILPHGSSLCRLFPPFSTGTGLEELREKDLDGGRSAVKVGPEAAWLSY